ncbi:MAG TPA: asparagine--tRNA ligase [Tenericutes bacterium]|nr:asparagine--tRNA ligase [Mycoplasmatota bacterium]
MKLDIKEIEQDFSKYEGKKVIIQGWIKNHRTQKEFGFIDINDGTSFSSIQVVYEAKDFPDYEKIQKYNVGSALTVTGTLRKYGENYEIHAESIKLGGAVDLDYPIQPKRHSREFLREVAHMRPRTNLFNAVFRVRSVLAQAIHTFFQERGFIYLHAPIITANDAEGAGDMFQVTTFDLENIPKDENFHVNYKEDFFGKKVLLTVSGQLEAEAFALSFKKVYTFGPTFRAEVSNTTRHASEFWMIEPEIAFADLSDIMNISEEMVKYIIKYVMNKCPKEMEFFNKFVKPGLCENLEKVLNSKFACITHKEAIEILKASGEKFENKPEFGGDLATEHEKYLTDVHFNGPVFITDWPKDIKAFYMRLNDDKGTVAAMDLLVPGAGELIGGSQREERIDLLRKRMTEMGISEKGLEWYLDLRRFGGCVHSGFGMGFERMLMFLTGVENIRDVIPFPRTPNNCEF